MLFTAHSYYSLRYGTIPPEELPKLAKHNGLESITLCDINNTSAMPDFINACADYGIHPIAGADIYRDNKHLYTLIAQNKEGLREINEFISFHNLQKHPYPTHPEIFEHCYVIYSLKENIPQKLKDFEWIGIGPTELNQLVTIKDQTKMLAWHRITMRNTSEFALHTHLRAINKNTLLTKLTANDLADRTQVFCSIDRIHNAYKNFPKLLQNSQQVVKNCHIDLNLKDRKNKKTYTESIYSDQKLLEKLSYEGLKYRYGMHNTQAKKRVEKELEIIAQLGFSAYFLIAWDIIRYSMSREYYHVGRGSGANSIVAFCLMITDVDPIELDLYFERFLNPKRSSPPDFDIDYSWRERDDVQDYIFKRFGRKHTALLGATSTFKGRSIYRELGKVYGLPKEELDNLAQLPEGQWQMDGIHKKIHQIAGLMSDFPNLRSIHAGGILISEEPIEYYTALDLPPKGYPTTQWDMYTAEHIGFDKLDILSQRGIGHIKDAVDIIRHNAGKNVDVHQVEKFKQDRRVKKLLMSGETNGCFYIESPAMRGLLNKLECKDYLTLVAASSIIRPGVAKSGMMKEYIKRFHNPKGFKYLHPIMKQQLEETYGVMVYQEDVIKICHHFAGLDLSDADVLRRAMSGKYRSKKEMERIVQRFWQNCLKKGYSKELTAEVWRQIESFAGYSFSKAHSASYAVESFQSLYLKAYYPKEFMVAVINNFGGFYRTWVYFNEAKRWGANIELPCVNNSNNLTCIKGKDIYTGFIHLQNFENKIARFIETDRKEKGPFESLHHFIRRIPASLDMLIILIRIGAFRFTGCSKAQLLWEVHLLLGKKKDKNYSRALFMPPSRNFSLPKLIHHTIEDAYDELELLGFPVSMNSFDMLQSSFRGEIQAKNLLDHLGKQVRMLGELVTIKYVYTSRKEIMHFAAFTDATGEFFDTVHFPPSLRAYPFKGQGVYLLLGKVVHEFGFPSLEVEKMAKLPFKPDPRSFSAKATKDVQRSKF